MAAIVRTTLGGTKDIVAQTDLSTLASAATVVTSSTENVMTSGVNALTSTGYPLSEIELVCTSTSAMTANTTVNVWFLRALDGSNYEDGSTGTPGTIPVRNPDVIFPIRAATSQRVTKTCKTPVGNFKLLVQNGTGQAFLSVNKISMKPFTDQFQ